MTRLDKARRAYREAKAETAKAVAAADNYENALKEANALVNAAYETERAAKSEMWAALIAEDPA